MSIVTDIFLPIALAFIMFALGLGLTGADFLRVLKQPKDFFVGAISQIILLPVIAFILVKELTVNSKSSISLQKHHHRSEHWMITHGKPKITINNEKFFKKENDSVFIPTGSTHRIENYFKKPVKIIEIQTGSILKESDIVRYQDIYGRIR